MCRLTDKMANYLPQALTYVLLVTLIEFQLQVILVNTLSKNVQRHSNFYNECCRFRQNCQKLGEKKSRFGNFFVRHICPKFLLGSGVTIECSNQSFSVMPSETLTYQRTFWAHTIAPGQVIALGGGIYMKTSKTLILSTSEIYQVAGHLIHRIHHQSHPSRFNPTSHGRFWATPNRPYFLSMFF